MTQPQFRFRQQNYIFQFKAGFFALCFVLFVVCCVLGVWQLKRYAYKKELLTTWQQRLSSAPLSFKQVLGSHESLQFQHVQMKGEYVNDLTMFVQNQIYQNKIGYDVLTPVQIVGEKKLLLVDRGWVEVVPSDKVALPRVERVSGQQKIAGHIKLLNEYQFILGDAILQPTVKPIVMQKIDIAALEHVTGKTFYPFIVRLDVSQPHGFVRDWVITNVLPERHMAYAVQWFALACVLLIAFFCFCCERVVKSNEKE